MRASPIDVCPTTSGHLCLIIIQHFCLIKHIQEHMEGGNRLRMDVVKCITPSLSITKSPNSSLVQDSIFMHVLIKIIKPSRHRWPITPSISRWLVATPNLVFSVPIAISTNMLKHTHTHTCSYLHNMFTPAHTHTHLLIFTQYVHPSTHTKSEILSSLLGVGVGN
jgi:hypothetical protein